MKNLENRHTIRRYTSKDVSDELLNRKLKAAYRHALTPILCVGEGLEIRQAGTHVAHTLDQVRAGVAGLTEAQAAELVIAYEPVWAIGTGEVAGPEDAQEMCAAIRVSSLSCSTRRSRTRSDCSTADRSKPAMRQRFCANATSTACWSAARVWTRPSLLILSGSSRIF